MAGQEPVKRRATRPIIVGDERKEADEVFLCPAHLVERYDSHGMTVPVEEHEEEQAEPAEPEREAGEGEEAEPEEPVEEAEPVEQDEDEVPEWPLSMDPAEYLTRGHDKHADAARAVLRAEGREDEIPE